MGLRGIGDLAGRIVGLAVVATLLLPTASLSASADLSRSVHRQSATTDYRWIPGCVVPDGGNLWVCDVSTRNQLFEIHASSGSLVRQLSAARYRFDDPQSAVTNGRLLWVESPVHNSVTVISATSGALVRVLGRGYGFDNPNAMALTGHILFVANDTSVTEIDPRTERLIRVVKGLAIHIKGGDAIATGGGVVAVSNSSNGYVALLNGTTGKFIRAVHSPAIGGEGDSVAVVGSTLWVADIGNHYIAVLDAVTGHLIRRVRSPGTNEPNAVRAQGGYVWAVNVGFPQYVTQFRPDGSVVKSVECGIPLDVAFGDDMVFVELEESVVELTSGSLKIIRFMY